MAVTAGRSIAGSVSAGCVEAAVIEVCQEVLETGRPRLLRYGVADESAWEVGLACGGIIRVFVEPFAAWNAVYDPLREALAERIPAAVVGVLEGPEDWLNRKSLALEDRDPSGDLNMGEYSEAILFAARAAVEAGEGRVLDLADGLSLLIDVYPPIPRLIAVGSVHIADPLVTYANTLGFETVVIDPRAAFATRERFPHAGQLIRGWPRRVLEDIGLGASDYVAVLTHDPKLDDQALIAALRSPAAYVGALGSQRTNRLRLERLREAGLSEDELARLHAPIGLPLGGRTPPEIALSIMSEIVQARASRARQAATG
jgi:xanthine dehydrogenase accessory factor